jgi:hypothetical protein
MTAPTTQRQDPIPNHWPGRMPAHRHLGSICARSHRTINGGIGHNLPQEGPQAFAEAIVHLMAENWWVRSGRTGRMARLSARIQRRTKMRKFCHPGCTRYHLASRLRAVWPIIFFGTR